MSLLRTSTTLVLGAAIIAGCHQQPAKTKAAPASASGVVQQGSVAQLDEKSADTKAAKKNDKKADNKKKNDKNAKRVAKAKKKDPLVDQTSDAAVIAIMLAYNNADMSYAQIAAGRAQNASVKAYASRMLTDKASVNQKAMDLIDRSDVDLEDNATTLDMREISAAHRAELKGQSGAAFDVAYMQGEIEYQRGLLAKIDDLLLPSSRHPELKKLVESVRPLVAAHLAQAEQIGGSLSTSVGATR